MRHAWSESKRVGSYRTASGRRLMTRKDFVEAYARLHEGVTVANCQLGTGRGCVMQKNQVFVLLSAHVRYHAVGELPHLRAQMVDVVVNELQLESAAARVGVATHFIPDVTYRSNKRSRPRLGQKVRVRVGLRQVGACGYARLVLIQGEQRRCS